MQQTKIQTIKDLITPLTEERGMFLVDVEVKSHTGMPEVWIYLDAEDRNVNLDECAEVSHELGLLMEAHELFERKYRLNVSSPGLSRPLTDFRQYKKNVGRVATLKYKDNDEYLKIEGVITDIEDQRIEITDKDEKTTSIDFEQVVETKIIPVL